MSHQCPHCGSDNCNKKCDNSKRDLFGQKIVDDEQLVNDDESGYYGSEQLAKNGESQEIETLETPVFTQKEAETQEFPCVCPDNKTAIFWIEYSTEEERFVSLSRFPFPYPDDNEWTTKKLTCPEHLVDFEINDMGVGYLINPDSKGYDDDLKWLDENGIKPNEPFKVKVKVEYYRCGEYGVDWDSYSEVEIIR